ncbi:hypothetical protein Afil01_10380 [Actinorhabdospora filicis]|uniref:M23ase beta-sheet core domain-containing protein n=1 Tax=Actinorhabdospora filicis TaxID=1785913 RepID=A0A9W6SIM8_9ACTN|nr:M23 family metallopeptidase [Actinorhabdospora filicis]GLZ76231.1 hypothetical protein Afil01_10380 [Actinorhabdospora filicis]
MRQRWFLGSLATVTIGLVLAASAAHADPADDKDRADRELASAEAALEGATERAQEAVRALTEAKQKLPDARERAAEAQGVLAAARVAASAAAEKAQAARDVYDAASVKMDEAEVAVDEARDALSTSVSQSYQGLGVVAFSSILNAGGPEEFVDRVTYMDRLAENQRGEVDAVTRARQSAKERQNETLVAKEDADEAKAAADAAVAEASSAAIEAENFETELNRLIDQRDSAVQVAEDERDDVMARYEAAERESRRIEGVLQAAANDVPRSSQGSSGSHHDDGGGRFLMPVAGWKSSDFGMRYDPYYNVWQLHAGMDLAAGGGAPIHAAAGGRVVQAGWNGGYGNYTCIYHGKGVSTCYAHQSSIGVWVGENVGRGDYIGAVGTTGASTGNHLHFEVRVNGTPVDPVNWLPGCLC